jgi:acyl-CoA thioester hydrolase
VETIDVEVRYAETDQMGVVHHAVYPVWFEIARTGLCRRTGHHYAEIERMGYLLMVTGVQVRYHRAIRYGDPVRVTCRMARMASRGLTFEYEVSSAPSGGSGGSGGSERSEESWQRMATGTTEHLWVDRATGKPCRIPEALRPGFEALARAD